MTADGKRRDTGPGGFPAVSLRQARQKAADARKLAEAGQDPIAAREAEVEARKAARAAEAEAAATAMTRTFEAITEACIRAQAPGWKNARTPVIWRATFKRHIFPIIGDMPVADIDRTAVLRALEGVWTSRPGIARKLVQRIGTVLRYAAAHSMRANDNPADVRILRHAGLSTLRAGESNPPSRGGACRPSWPNSARCPASRRWRSALPS